MQLLSCNEKYLPNSQTTSKWSCSKKNKINKQHQKNTQAVISRGKSLEWKKIFFLLRTPKEFKTDVCYIFRDCPLEVVSSPSQWVLFASFPPSSHHLSSLEGQTCVVLRFFFFLCLSLPTLLPFPFHSFTLLAEMLYCGSWCFGEVFPPYPLSFGKWRNDPMAILQG